MSRGPRILLWTYMPTHHQSAFFDALREEGVDLVVHYFNRVSDARLRLGWTEPSDLPAGERMVAPRLSSLAQCADWRDRIHVIPGYGNRFLLRLALHLCTQKVDWVNWSEPSQQSLRWYLNYPVKRTFATLINRYALGALAIGDMARDDFIRWGVRLPLIRFLPYSVAGLSAAPHRPTRSSGPHPIRFAFVGALCHRKGIDVLLKAFQLVLRDHPDAKLQLLGSDESQGNYQAVAAQLGIASAVEFRGSVPAVRIADLMADCDTLILPSRFDGWGMVLNEAASLGKALIATEACGSAHHLIEHDRNGYRVPADDHLSLASAMQRYCARPELVEDHGRHSRELFAGFTPKRNAIRMNESLASLGGTRRQGTA